MRNVPPDCAELYKSPLQYDIEHDDIKEDIAYYLGQVSGRPGARILELACGTGRVTLGLAAAGYEVTGLDISPDMLETAKAKAAALGSAAGNVEWVLADMREFDLGRKFPYVMLPFNSLCHLHDRESVEACFSCVARHLEDDGRFMLDLANPHFELLTCDPDAVDPVAEYFDPDRGKVVVISEHAVYDEPAQVKRITWTYSVGGCTVRTARLDMRLFYPLEVECLLHHGGLRVLERMGTYSGAPFANGSPRQILLCGKAPH